MNKIVVPGIIGFLIMLNGCGPRKTVEPTPSPKQEQEETGEVPEEEELLFEEEEEKKVPEIPLELKTVYFDFDKYNIKPDAANALKENAKVLKFYPDVQVVVEGHTCDIGTEEYNIALGERRAKSTRDFLIKLGISPQRLSIVSYGETRLVDPNNKPINRRVEFRIK